MPSLYERTKESLNNAAEYTKECAESAKEQLFGQPNAEDRAAEKVRDAADWTADKVGEARERVNEDDHTFMESVKEKFQDAVDYTKDCAHSAKEMVFGETNVREERRGPVFNPRENTVKSEKLFEEIRDNNEDTALPHVHDY